MACGSYGLERIPPWRLVWIGRVVCFMASCPWLRVVVSPSARSKAGALVLYSLGARSLLGGSTRRCLRLVVVVG